MKLPLKSLLLALSAGSGVSVPEPTSLALLATGLVGLAAPRPHERSFGRFTSYFG
jgi:hypothetical protein